MIAGRARHHTPNTGLEQLETAPKNPSAPAAAIAAAAAAFRELGLAQPDVEAGTELAQLAGQLTEEPEIAVAAWIVQARASGLACSAATAATRFGSAAEALARQLELLGDIGLPPDWTASRGLNPQQAETLRKMLLATAADPRLIVARLAMELVRLRHARSLPEAERTRLALEAREIYAPLANRLGVWSLKWELEDLAFRQLEPGDYHRIATALAERRVDREQYIEKVCALLAADLAAAGVRAQVYGRPKHIYSIWRKMQRKQLAFEQLYDVRAVRIVVGSVVDCYAALGVVHGRWRMLPGEFDDYIATPKDNQYRSIHTAVIGPEDRSLEIQIRTRDMHEHAELGVAAHWRYKEGGARDAGYERKIEWARRMLDPLQAGDAGGDFIDRVRQELFSDRLYALTPRGEVIDLPRGATPLDFAYHVHTQLGHSCRGARVNGRIAPLDQPLANGEVVEIITGRSGGPSRDWLNAESGFLASPRSRAKVRAWFHQQDAALQAAAGAAAASATAPPAAAAAAPPEQLPISAPPRRASGRSQSAVEIEGVGDMPTTMARCCAPVPPEAIAGYVTLGRGVTVHRAGCRSLARMSARNPERLLRVDWNRSTELQMPVQIRIEAYDRRGLLRDVSDVMAQERLSIEGVNSSTDPADRVATIVMRTAVRDTAQLRQVLNKLAGVNSVLRAQRLSG
jgi:GTP pyrophosphokinase